MLQHKVPNPWILESKDSEGGFAHIPLGATREFAGGLRGTPRGSHPQDDATGPTSAPPT